MKWLLAVVAKQTRILLYWNSNEKQLTLVKREEKYMDECAIGYENDDNSQEEKKCQLL